MKMRLTFLLLMGLFPGTFWGSKCLAHLKDSEIAAIVKNPTSPNISSGGNTALRVVALEGGFVGRAAKHTPLNLASLKEAAKVAEGLSQRAQEHSAPVLRVIEAEGEVIAVSKKAPGKQLNTQPKANDIEALSQIPQEHYDSLVATVRELRQKKIAVDSDPDNLFYDPKSGFCVIDLNSSSEVQVATDAVDVANYLTGQIEFITRPTDSSVFKLYEESFGWNRAHLETIANKIHSALQK